MSLSQNKQDHRDWNLAMEQAFENGTLEDASSEELAQWLSLLSTWKVDSPVKGNEGSRIIRGLAINHFQMANELRRIDASNNLTQKLVILLAVIAIGLAAMQVIIGFIGICK